MPINDTSPFTRTLTARVGIDPRFAGSIHDDASAETFGFRSALVPGPTLCAYMAHLLVEAWGDDWLRRGTLSQASRRPVYDGTEVVVTAQPVAHGPDGLTVAVGLGAGGDISASATGGLPHQASAGPDLRDFPHRPHPQPPRRIERGQHAAGDTFYSTPFVYTQAMHEDYLRMTDEDLPSFVDRGIAPPGYLLTVTMRDAIASYETPTPGVHVSMSQQNFGLAHVGDTLSTAGRIIGAYEKKGHHYVDSEQLVIANRVTPVCLIRRTAIYALREVSANEGMR